ncbi:40S ribosomal protein S21-2-like [Cucurbita maxima]|uniref:40S ribosomal protein S21-2-like n=1 Tax=Cucurbita maxima TaxID=3661 RepID=A0A6J1IXY4_CUCMA|nr:40S ribosomal protein S21-2-like [Cucurbita maxima]
MQNEEGKITGLNVPQRIDIWHLDENGIYTGQFSTFALCGFLQAQGDGDSAVDRLWQKKNLKCINNRRFRRLCYSGSSLYQSFQG